MGVIVPGLFIVSIMTFSFIFKKYEWIGNANITSALGLILSAIVLNFLNDILANYKSKDSSKNYIKYNTYFGISFKIWGIIFCIFSIIALVYGVKQTGIEKMTLLTYMIDCILLIVAVTVIIFISISKRIKQVDNNKS